MFNKQKVELDKLLLFFKFQGFLSLYLDKIIVKFLSNAISIRIFLSRDIAVLGNMGASKLHCSAILPKNIARVNQPIECSFQIFIQYRSVVGQTLVLHRHLLNFSLELCGPIAFYSLVFSYVNGFTLLLRSVPLGIFMYFQFT